MVLELLTQVAVSILQNNTSKYYSSGCGQEKISGQRVGFAPIQAPTLFTAGFIYRPEPASLSKAT